VPQNFQMFAWDHHLPLPTWAPMRDILAVAVRTTPNPTKYEDELPMSSWVNHELDMFLELTVLTDGGG